MILLRIPNMVAVMERKRDLKTGKLMRLARRVGGRMGRLSGDVEGYCQDSWMMRSAEDDDWSLGRSNASLLYFNLVPYIYGTSNIFKRSTNHSHQMTNCSLTLVETIYTKDVYKPCESNNPLALNKWRVNVKLCTDEWK
jgi:hypothetical protein